MFKIMLDGKQHIFEKPVSIFEAIQNTNPSLLKSAIAAKANGRLIDLNSPIQDDLVIEVLTGQDKDGLEVIRHSTAHLLAHAVKRLFPKAQITIGPVIEDGFYYDFALDHSLTSEDLVSIELEMKKIVDQKIPIVREEISHSEAIRLFNEMGEVYKVKIIQDIPSIETLSFYRQGDFIDLCRGPHVPNTSYLKAFKLIKVSGAYWRGDSKNEMLQRVYGTAWQNQKDLEAYLNKIKEAEKRDHRKLGKQLGMFHFQEEAPGMVFWHESGWTVYQLILTYMQKLLAANGYQEVRTPQIIDKIFWERSGHWEKFGKEMFVTETEHRTYAIKPMSCPCHVQIYNQGIKSYRDLPIRLAEFGNCHRCEPSGTLHGLMRLRNFVQDDAHIFCTEDQIQLEVISFIELLTKVYADFGFSEILLKLSTRPVARIGSDEMWDKAERALEEALNIKKLKWELCPGEGAFYGPKIEFSLKDCLGRVWQCGTVQVDFSMPERLQASYIDSAGAKKTVAMIHRAVFGSLERFIGILLEHYGGNLPIWLAPIQAVVLNVTERHSGYVQEVYNNLTERGVRMRYDLRNEKIGFKIREHTMRRVPYLLVVGDREMDSQSVSIRFRDGSELGCKSLDEFCSELMVRSKNKN